MRRTLHHEQRFVSRSESTFVSLDRKKLVESRQRRLGVMKGRREMHRSPSLQNWTMWAVSKSSKWLFCLLIIASCSGWICRDSIPSFSCQALSSSSTTPKFAYPRSSLSSVEKSQLAILDGAEWKSVQSVLRDQKLLSPRSSSKYGYMNIVTGRDEKSRRVVAMQCMDNEGSQDSSSVYEDSIAFIPNKVTDTDAISTYISSLSAVHCALPKVENIGGGNDSSATISTGKAVVLGSGELACFSAEGLASLGMEVYLVNNNGNANLRKNVGKLRVIKPSVEDSGFATYIEKFDCLVDTLGNERTKSNMATWDEEDDDNMISLGQSMLEMLRRRHNCYNYVSTLTYSQGVIASEGLLFGPRKVDTYGEKIDSIQFLQTSRDSQPVCPPASIGNTVGTLMNKGIIFSEKQRTKLCSKKSNAIRGWSLSDFWEQMSWPRDSSGSGTTRFGLPVREDPEDLEGASGILISEAPYNPLQAKKGTIRDEEYDDIGDFGTPKKGSSSSSPKNKAIQNNPYVLNIMDIEGLQSEIVNAKKDCIMFMSAKFCKTCKTINPSYTRMARMSQENREAGNFAFVKAETSGASGKELAAHVSVRAVPSFVFIREGRILGKAYASKLPSPKIDRALQILTTGEEWDYSLLDDDE